MAKKNDHEAIMLVRNRIFEIRGQRVILDADLAQLYGVETKILNKAVSRNRRRFPDDFAFRLTPQEFVTLRFQIGTSNEGRGGRRDPSTPLPSMVPLWPPIFCAVRKPKR